MPDDPYIIAPDDEFRAGLNGPAKKSEFAYSQRRPATVRLQSEAVERAIATMQERLGEPLSLDTLAEVATLSRFHFSRVFHHVTGLAPVQFLAALRLAEAKRLLLTSSLNVADVCFQVGYNSLGSFTVRFSRSVGVSPGRFRELRQPFGLERLDKDYDRGSGPRRAGAASLDSQVIGRIRTRNALAGPVFVGLFKTSVPEGEPVRCTILQDCGAYRLRKAPEGTYYVLAASFPWPDDGPGPLLPEGGSLHIGSGGAVHIARGQVLRDVDLWLRPALPTDPPVLVALPVLLARLQAGNQANTGMCDERTAS